MRSKLKTLFLLLILPLFITACTTQDIPLVGRFLPEIDLPGDNGGGGAPVTLTWWGLWEDEAVVNQLIAKYQEQNPNVTIVYENRSVLDLAEYKARVFNRAQNPDPPDIIRVHNSWVPRMTALDFLAPAPTSIFDANTYLQTFYNSASSSAIVGNNVYAAPMFYDGLVLVYNKEHFRQVGQVQPPTAWEEFRRLALELTVRGGDGNSNLQQAGAAIGSADNIDFSNDILGLLWAQANVEFPDGLESKAARDALVFYTNFVKEDRVWQNNFPEATQAFVDGRVSMIFVPTWRVLDILNAVEDAQNVGVAPVPQALPESPASWGTFWMESVPTTANNTEESWKFIKFLTEEEQQRLFFDENSKGRFFGSPYALQSLGESLAASPFLGPAVLTAPFSFGSAEISGRAGNQKQETALDAAVNAVLSGTSAEQALEEALPEISF